MVLVPVPLHRRLRPRDTGEAHRASTPLELFFDLVFVVAIAAAGGELHHGLAEGHADALLGFSFTFLAIWWAWMNYTWFASAYDTGDVVHRVLTFVIMTGSLMMAAGVPDLFADGQSLLAVLGYTVMRVGMVAMWLRAAHGHPERRRTCLGYAAGIALVQVFWLARLGLGDERWLVVTFFAGMAGELAVPWVAERSGSTPYHAEHIAERYGLFTIIVLGEVVLSSVVAVQDALGHPDADLLVLVVGGLLVVFASWWLYFKRDHADLFSRDDGMQFVAGYGHLLVFAAVAASGAALAAAVDVVTHHGHASVRFVGLALGLALATYALVLAGIHALGDRSIRHLGTAGAVAVGVLVVPLLGLPMGVTVLGQGLVLAAAVAGHVATSQAEIRSHEGADRP